MIRLPEADKHWTTVYYGPRGSGKTLHQAKETYRILRYLNVLYRKNPQLNRAIVFTNQKLSPKIESEYMPDYLYYWDDAGDFRYCPRKECWKGKKKHRLHGCYLIFDDISNILPPDTWASTPMWMRKTFFQGRHFGIRILANLQDPFAVDVNFRRTIDMAYKFTKLFGNKDPDETKKPIKHIFGIYRRRKIDAETLWRYGDLPEETIRMMLIQKEEDDERLKEMGKEMDIIYSDSWFGSYHLYNRSGKFLGMNISSTDIYDTTQDVQEYKPKGYLHEEYHCIDPKHNHSDPKALNYCKFKKVDHILV